MGKQEKNGFCSRIDYLIIFRFFVQKFLNNLYFFCSARCPNFHDFLKSQKKPKNKNRKFQMTSAGSNEMSNVGNLTFFEIPINISNDEPKQSDRQSPREEPKGGLSFSVGLDENQVFFSMKIFHCNDAVF